MFRKLFCTFYVLSFSIIIARVVYANNCKYPLKPIKPDNCCRFPDLFKQNVLELCKKENNSTNQCFYECVFKHTEICRWGTCSQQKAEDYVDWIMAPEHPFRDIIKNAYGSCIRKVNETNVNVNSADCNPMPEMILLCVKNEMFLSCPPAYWVIDDVDCVKQREFVTKCVQNN